MTLQAIFLLPASENCQKPSGPQCRGGPTLGTRTIFVFTITFYVTILYSSYYYIYRETIAKLILLVVENSQKVLFNLSYGTIPPPPHTHKTIRIEIHGWCKIH